MRTMVNTILILTITFFASQKILADTHDVFNEGGIDTWDEVKKLTASDSEADDLFGWSVAIDGDVAVIGARNNDSNTGATYIFERNTGGSNAWGDVKKLTASDAENGDLFGYSVAIANDLVVVGAQGENSGGVSAGAAYVFERNAGGINAWNEIKKLTASDAKAYQRFGCSVAIAGDVAIAGAYMDGSAAFKAGAAYVFEQNQGGANAWGEVKKLTAFDAAVGDYFGYSVAVDSDLAVVGAELKGAGGTKTGAAYLFERNAGGVNAWGNVKKLTASDEVGYERFGYSVAAASDIVVVGAPYKNEGSSEVGAAYVFERNEGGANAWGEVKKLTGSNASINNRFGWSVSVASNVAVAGCYHSDTAYVFGRNEGGVNAWGEVMPLFSHEVNSGFGRSVSVAGDVGVVGADNSGLVGFDTGAAFIFEKSIIPEPCLFIIYYLSFIILKREN